MKPGAHALALSLLSVCGLVMAQPARIEGRGASVFAPAGWTCNARLLAAGGPIACANFSEPYARGGLLPPGGAEIEITSVARPMALDVYARGELKGVRDVKLQEAPVGGRPALRAVYTEQVAPGVSTDNLVYYVAQGNRLYKFYLTYHSGDSQAAALIRTWERVVREALEVIAAWLLVFALAASAQTDLEYSAASPNAAQIDAYLARKKSALGGLGESFSTYGREYNVDPRLVVAIAGAETTFGAHVCAEKNAWNWFYRRTCPPSTFQTYEAGMERVAKFLRLSYINRGYDSIELIRQKYCASGCENWVPLVTTFYHEMPSNVTAVAPSAPSSSAPAPSSRQATRILGMPPFVLFFAAALIVALWVSRSLGR